MCVFVFASGTLLLLVNQDPCEAFDEALSELGTTVFLLVFYSKSWKFLSLLSHSSCNLTTLLKKQAVAKGIQKSLNKIQAFALQTDRHEQIEHIP